jgi:hypothetical protein
MMERRDAEREAYGETLSNSEGDGEKEKSTSI